MANKLTERTDSSYSDDEMLKSITMVNNVQDVYDVIDLQIGVDSTYSG